MIHLLELSLRAPTPAQAEAFPFRVPAIQALAGATLAFPSAVTFFIGENGSGKSTLLEAIAAAAGSITVGSTSVERDPTLQPARALARRLKLAWSRRTQRGFFMRSEDFFGYARYMQALRAEAEAELRAIDQDPTLSEKGRALARMPHAGTIAGIERRYGAGLDAGSHGESFFTLFQSRFVPDGLYLLDEPEAPLSPRRQLALLAMIKQLAEEQGAQFIIATHSPVLMATPGATIYSFDDGRIQPLAYDEVEQVRFTREFLSNPQLFLRHL